MKMELGLGKGVGVGLRTFFIALFLTIPLLGMIGIKHWTLQKGTPILLQVDNSDLTPLFNGEPLRIRYHINAIPYNKLADENAELYPHQIVYVVLKKGHTAYWEPQKIYFKKPNVEPNEIAIKGEIINRTFDNDVLFIKYGIENYSIPLKDVKKIEKPDPDDKINIQVVVDKFGNAGIRAILVDNEEKYIEKLY